MIFSKFNELKKTNSNSISASNIYKDNKYVDRETFYFFLYINEKFINICFLIHCFSIIIKLIVGTYGYSGENVPPKFGDFEAQRHWMEITVNNNLENWYKSSENHPENYWPIDYPPLSAYFAYILGKIFQFVFPDGIELIKSRGYESQIFKILMRLTVIFSDLIFYHIPLQLFLNRYFDKKQEKFRNLKIFIGLLIGLLSPCLVLIDHGHFQYNCVFLGLYILAFKFLLDKKLTMSIFVISLSVNFKQMGAYYLLPFLFYALKYINKSSSNIFTFILYCLYCAFVTVISFIFIWSPFIFKSNFNDVIKRIFPLWRGIFEDNVATFWCTLNRFVKLKHLGENLLTISLVITILFCLPSVMILFKKSRRLTSLAFLCCSMSFFLFSFHVHEKTIIVPFVAFILCYEEIKILFPSFILLSSFSLFPLLARENQEIPYFIITISAFICSKIIQKMIEKIRYLEITFANKYYRESDCFLPPLFSFLDYVNIIFVILFHYIKNYYPPPSNLPYLYEAINSAYCFLWFWLIYFTSFIRMVSIVFFEDCN